MDAVAAPQNYTFHALSLPFIMAALGLVGMSLYVLLMRGSQILRASFLLVCGGLLPVVASYALAGSTRSPAVAASLYKLGFALAPLAASGILVFEIALAQRLARYRLLIGIALGSSLLQSALMLTTSWFFDGVWQTSLGLYHFRAGPLAPLFLGSMVLWVGLSLLLGWRRLAIEQLPLRRRQIKGSLLAFSAFGISLLDAPLAYGIGIYPISWLAYTVGATLALRSLLQDDLIHARSLDPGAPMAVLYLVASATGVWVVWHAAGQTAFPIQLPMLVLLYLLLREAITVVQLVRQPAASLTDTLLERLIEQHAARIHSLNDEPEIGQLTNEMVKLGLGCRRVEFLLASTTDYSWRTLDGQVLPEGAYPDPFTGSLMWFQEHPRPIQREDLQTRRLGDSRDTIEHLFEANQADVMVPLVNRDDVVGMVIIGEFKDGRVLTREELRFLERLQEYTAAALVYARMHREANARVALHKEMELAAAVQSAFVPKGDTIDCGTVTISGIWAPASRCGGDWWWVHNLPDGRVLVLIGDVTGHGVAAAMVTAAAKGCYDVAQKLMGNELDLVRLLELLDASVRLVGGDSFHMTCFATLLDPAAGKITYANAGHAVPYLCRPLADGSMHLGVLSARGTPLGAGTHTRYHASTRELEDGDTLIWYTDGIVECVDRDRNQFGDRRLQRLLRKIDQLDTDVRGIRDYLLRAVVAFQNGHAPDDDITLVVARVDASRAELDMPLRRPAIAK